MAKLERAVVLAASKFLKTTTRWRCCAVSASRLKPLDFRAARLWGQDPDPLMCVNQSDRGNQSRGGPYRKYFLLSFVEAVIYYISL